MGAGFHHGLGKESRAITLQNGMYSKMVVFLWNFLLKNSYAFRSPFVIVLNIKCIVYGMSRHVGVFMGMTALKICRNFKIVTC